MKCDKSDIEAVETPNPTATWQPIPHTAVLEELEKALASLGIRFSPNTFELARDGKHMFATYSYQLSQVGQIGVRNSHDKTLSLAVCGGIRIINCSNLMFSGEWHQFRRHTPGIAKSGIGDFLARACESIRGNAPALLDWMDTLAHYPMDRVQADHFTMEAIRCGIVPPSKVQQLDDARAIEVDQNYGETLAASYQGTTRVLREYDPSAVTWRCQRLNRLTEATKTTLVAD